MNYLQDDLNVFLQVVSKHHQREITVCIEDCYLPRAFFRRVKRYTKSPNFLKINEDTSDENTTDIETGISQEVTDSIYKKTLNTWATEKLLKVVSLRDSNLPRHVHGPILQALSSHGNITSLDLSGNNLGIHGIHLVNTIKSWGPEPSLQELDLSHCSLPVEVCRPLLSALERCKKLTELWLPGNTLTGCLGNLLA